jgi:hypothetical protein
VYPGDHKVTTWPTPATAGSIWKLYSDELASQFGRGLKISKTLGNGIVAAPTFGKGVTVGKDAAGNTLGANGVPRRAAKRSARYPSGATAGGPVCSSHTHRRRQRRQTPYLGEVMYNELRSARPKGLSVAEILNGAADLLATKGHMRDEYKNRQSRMCMVQAMYETATGDMRPVDSFAPRSRMR